jgi:hypothetical protein
MREKKSQNREMKSWRKNNGNMWNNEEKSQKCKGKVKGRVTIR